MSALRRFIDANAASEAQRIEMHSDVDELLEALQDALEFIEDHVDVSDGPYGEPKPNRAMQLAEPIRALVARATGEQK